MIFVKKHYREVRGCDEECGAVDGGWRESREVYQEASFEK